MSTIRVGFGYDIHPFALAESGRPLVLAGVAIDGHVGLAGHSDADAVAHAVCDSLLGAAGLPDLGTLYPASEGRWENADSMAMLRDVVERITGEGWAVGNVDIVINAEVPQLAPHLEAMRENLAVVLRCEAVNLKPKRGEGIGAVGRAEGIAVHAVALINR
jgi:2-C-methyl-D-erythritol 2,4-cyclodiphosphate synthase